MFEDKKRGNPYDVMVNVLDCDILVIVFELQSYNYIHFHTNTIGKDINSLILRLLTEEN